MACVWWSWAPHGGPDLRPFWSGAPTRPWGQMGDKKAGVGHTEELCPDELPTS